MVFVAAACCGLVAHMTNMNEEPKLEFARNENVVIAENAPPKFRPSQLAWVISGRVVEDDRQAKAVNYPVGTILYLVEFVDGKDVEMPGEFIRHRSVT